ncbi:hypothetical protein JAAARDRAFT_124736 [Jaapia argillacea MUCL 33604]|uniref:Ubiquitin thioesterase OTU n=1 Tax=Jaapia argillacea MUCL 33604 TaxID=933084 RepID=A0A067QBV5_9AGAM|nr:hypothetical protein JAAARDRAFT_124736 [Jaapia argillacea MUCL 33604]
MAPLRLRHPKGVSTLQVDFDTFTVQDLQQEIYAASEILPSQQDLKSGYPPRSLTLIPELPLESLGLKTGDQLIVNQKPGSASRGVSSGATQAAVPSPARTSSVPSGRAAEAPSSLRASQAPVARPAPSSSSPASVETNGGTLVHRIVPDDNSCLFSSVALIFEQDISKAQQQRKIVADAIRKDMETYNEAILGRPRDEYISTILKPTSWGGAIELAIFAKHYSTEIASVDVETGRIDHFTPPPASDSGSRCVVIYSGIHYDAASLAPFADAPTDFHQTVFPVISSGDDDPILKATKELATILRSKKAFTNTATFDLKCEGLKGEKEARAHAKDTGHTAFGEY